LLEVLQKTTSFVWEREDEFIKMILDNSSLQQGETSKTHTRKIAKNEKRIAELDKMFSSLYEDKVNGEITPERFKQMSAGFDREQSVLREENETLQAEIDAINMDSMNADNFVSLVRRYTRFEELTTPIINEFIDRIEVHESVWSEATEESRRLGTRTQKIDIYLKYIGAFSVPDERTMEEIEAERIEEEKLEKRRKKQREYARRKAAVKRAAKEAEEAPEAKISDKAKSTTAA
jgi:hypothetical protein